MIAGATGIALGCGRIGYESTLDVASRGGDTAAGRIAASSGVDAAIAAGGGNSQSTDRPDAAAGAPEVPDAGPPGGASSAPVTADFPVTEDADVDSTKKNSNNGTLDTMLVDGSQTPATALWRADLSAIPTTATVLSSELHITTSNDVGDPCFIYEVLESWSELNVTWNQREPGTFWLGEGASPPSRGTDVYGGPIDTSEALTTRVVPLDAALVGRWILNPAENYGAAMVMTTSDGATFKTRDDTVGARRPFLRITYVP